MKNHYQYMQWTRIVWQFFRNDCVKGLLNYCKIRSINDPFTMKTLLFSVDFLPIVDPNK
jgi:hypothetical protein